jgi:hypothetical protein
MFSGNARVLKSGQAAILRMSVPEPVVMNTLKDVLGRQPAELSLRLFMSLNNGNLIRLYGSSWREDHPLATDFDEWADAQPKDMVTGETRRYWFRAWSGWTAYKQKLWDNDMPISHVWDLVQREAHLRIVVVHLDLGSDPYLRCPPLGAEEVDEDADLLLFFEQDCRFEPIVWVERKGSKMVPHKVLTQELMRTHSISLTLPLSAFGACRPASEYVRPLRLVEVAGAKGVLVLDPYSRVVALQQSSNHVILPVYPSALPDETEEAHQYGFEARTLPTADAELAFLSSEASRMWAYAAPARWIVSTESQPPMRVALETVSSLIVPVQPEPWDASNKSLPVRYVHHFDLEDDKHLAMPAPSTNMVALEALRREDQVRDWVLYEIQSYLHKRTSLLEEVAGHSKPTVRLRTMIQEWVRSNVSLSGSASAPVQKLKTSCSELSKTECGGICVLDRGTCKTGLGGSPLSLQDIVDWLLYALFTDPKKRLLILEGQYPRVTSTLFWERDTEVVFSESDPYPDHEDKKCSRRNLFDEVRNDKDQEICD